MVFFQRIFGICLLVASLVVNVHAMQDGLIGNGKDLCVVPEPLGLTKILDLSELFGLPLSCRIKIVIDYLEADNAPKLYFTGNSAEDFIVTAMNRGCLENSRRIHVYKRVASRPSRLIFGGDFLERFAPTVAEQEKAFDKIIQALDKNDLRTKKFRIFATRIFLEMQKMQKITTFLKKPNTPHLYLKKGDYGQVIVSDVCDNALECRAITVRGPENDLTLRFGGFALRNTAKTYNIQEGEILDLISGSIKANGNCAALLEELFDFL